MASKKKRPGKGKDDDWDDDAAERRLAALKVKDESDDGEGSGFSDDEPVAPAPKNKLAALMLLDDDEDDDKSDASKSDDEAPKKAAPAPKKKDAAKAKPPAADDDDEAEAATGKDKKKGAKKGKKGKKEAEDDDLDALLANIEAAPEKKGKKKATKVEEEAVEKPDEGAAAPATEEAEGEKPAEDDAKKKKKKKKKAADKEKSETPAGDEEPNEEKKEDVGEAEEGNEDGDEKDGKDKKKKKKDKKKDEPKKENKKTKHVNMIKELLRAKQEAEEAEARRVKEEEERLERLQKEKEEEERLIRERKEREKQKRKEKEEELKRQGKFLTAAQKEKQKRAMLQLAAANVQIPTGATTADDGAPKKRIVYGKKKPQQQKKDSIVEAPKEESPKVEEPKEEATPTPPPEPEKPVDAEEEPLDDWEMADAEEKVPEVVAAVTAAVSAAPKVAEAKPAVAAKEDKEESEEEEESSSDEDEESSSEEETSSEEESSSDDEEAATGRESSEQIIERVKARLKKRRELAEAKRSVDNLRAPVICVLGHVDTGKTKMLDTIRRTNVQDGEAGGITQQIGATQVPGDAIKERCKIVKDFNPETMKIPGLLIIDTPGHESFANLRSRGSSLCDYAILVVDIMHGLEPQTIESLKLLLKRATPFVIALNKVDRLYSYASNPRKDIWQHLKSQPNNTQLEFKERYEKVVVEFAEQGLNVALACEKKDWTEYVPIVPTSAFLGDGVSNLLAHIVTTTQNDYAKKLSYSEELDATVMEVKAIAGLGTTIDVILVNGKLSIGDIIVLTGTDGAIMTQIRDLLMPAPLKELRVKNDYQHFKEIKAAQGVKLIAKGLEKALAGLPLYVANREDEVDFLKEEAEGQLTKALTSIKKKPEGVYVQASTLGSLEALLEFLKTQKIPYANVNIGPVHRRDVQKAAAMLEKNAEFACILAFDVRVEKDAQQFADKEGVRIFQADIIYHLEDNFLKYREELRQKERKDHEHLAIFPCKLRVLPQHVFNARNPIVMGVNIEAGQLRKGTPICVPSKEGIVLGTVSSIEKNHDQVDLAKAGDEVCIKIENTTGEAPKLYGRHFTHEDTLVSRISRESIDVCKKYFRDDLSKSDWQLVIQLKKLLDIF